MSAENPSPQSRLHLASVVILIVGLLAAALIYVMASKKADADRGDDQIVGGQAYRLDDSARQQQQLERLGGKAAVYTVAFNQWFSSLWEGKRLAYTVAALTVVVAFGCYYIAGLMGEEVD